MTPPDYDDPAAMDAAIRDALGRGKEVQPADWLPVHETYREVYRAGMVAGMRRAAEICTKSGSYSQSSDIDVAANALEKGNA